MLYVYIFYVNHYILYYRFYIKQQGYNLNVQTILFP